MAKKFPDDMLLHMNSNMLCMRFPQKLWKIINECRSGAIRWSRNGRSVVLNYSKFQIEYLDGQKVVFKTSNINSFVRQLNLYGFKKVNPQTQNPIRVQNPDVHKFHHDFFIKGRIDLLQKVTRKPQVQKSNSSYPKLQYNSPLREVSSPKTSRLPKFRKALQDALDRQTDIFKSRFPNTYNASTSVKIETVESCSRSKKSHSLGKHHNDYKKLSLSNSSLSLLSQMKSEDKENCGNRVDKAVSSLHSFTDSSVCEKPIAEPLRSQNFWGPQLYSDTFFSDPDMSHIDNSLSYESVFSHMDRGLSDQIFQFLVTDSRHIGNHFGEQYPSSTLTQNVNGHYIPSQMTMDSPASRIVPICEEPSHSSFSEWDVAEEFGMVEEMDYFNIAQQDLPSLFECYQ